MSLGLYVHLPFCRVHCTYCAFAISTDLSAQESYLSALLAEGDARGTRSQRLDSVYFGGGTPSRMPPASLAAIAGRIRDRFDVADDVEFSMESNPEDVTPDTLQAWRRMGVNRLSIGVQSFDDRELRPLGRLHG